MTVLREIGRDLVRTEAEATNPYVIEAGAELGDRESAGRIGARASFLRKRKHIGVGDRTPGAVEHDAGNRSAGRRLRGHR